MAQPTIVHVKGYRVEIVNRSAITILAGGKLKNPPAALCQEIADYLVWEDFLDKGKIKIGVTAQRV